jgi:vanillate O-demethylase monooxygenase subunit
MVDNLMDLTHETYVHATSIGQKEIDETPCTTRVEGDQVVTERFMNGIQAPPFWQMALRSHQLPTDQPVDRWQICRFTPPSHVMIEVGVALAGQGGYDAPADRQGVEHRGRLHHARDRHLDVVLLGHGAQLPPDDKALTAQIREGQGKIFSEDLQVLERSSATCCSWPGRGCSSSTSTPAACRRAR